MDTMTMVSQQCDRGLSAPAPIAARTLTAVPTFAPMPTTGNAYGTHMSWLGGVEANGCFSGTNVAKRINTGRLERFLT
jgi:hypothetical protein